jgi:hypothetical protein
MGFSKKNLLQSAQNISKGHDVQGVSGADGEATPCRKTEVGNRGSIA